jgi:hypothetical protein
MKLYWGTYGVHGLTPANLHFPFCRRRPPTSRGDGINLTMARVGKTSGDALIHPPISEPMIRQSGSSPANLRWGTDIKTALATSRRRAVTESIWPTPPWSSASALHDLRKPRGLRIDDTDHTCFHATKTAIRREHLLLFFSFIESWLCTHSYELVQVSPNMERICTVRWIILLNAKTLKFHNYKFISPF